MALYGLGSGFDLRGAGAGRPGDGGRRPKDEEEEACTHLLRLQVFLPPGALKAVYSPEGTDRWDLHV